MEYEYSNLKGIPFTFQLYGMLSIQTRRASPSPPSHMEYEYSNLRGIPFTSSYMECEYSKPEGNPSTPPLPSRAIQDASIQTQRASPSPPSHMEYEYSNPKGIRFTSSYMECEYSNPKEIPPPLHFPAGAIQDVSIQTRRASPSPPSHMEYEYSNPKGIRFTSSYMECEYSNPKEIPPPLHFPAELYRM